jgi:hypothetical protein
MNVAIAKAPPSAHMVVESTGVEIVEVPASVNMVVKRTRVKSAR